MSNKKYFNTILFIIALLLLAGTFIWEYAFDSTEVIGNSMADTLKDKDHILIHKLAYQWKGPKRFDVIVFPFKQEEGIQYIKRVVGLPGETIQIKNSVIYINGNPLYEEYGRESMDEYTEGIAAEPITLGNDEYFVLGDNRNDSMDSRDVLVGPVKREDIIGKAVFCLYPFSSFGKIRS